MSDAEWWQTETNDSVATHPRLWRPLSRAVGGFDLDVAAGCEPTPIADDRFTPDDDGLSQQWHGDIFMNPEFSEKGAWFRKLVAEYRAGRIDRAVAVCNTGTDADWFQEYASTADLLCFLNGRGWYLQDGRENFATFVAVWNPNDALRDVLHGLGAVVEPQSLTEQTTL